MSTKAFELSGHILDALKEEMWVLNRGTGLAGMLKSGVLADPVLVSREREFEELQGCLRSAINGRGMTVFVSGEAGSGKTRLVTEFLSLAQEQGITLLRGYCLSSTSMPYFPFLQAFNSYASKAGNASIEVKAWLTGLKQVERSANQSNLSPQVWKDLTFAAVNQALLAEAACNPIVLFIDDLHWADSASLSLIHYIARSITPHRILILGTLRTEELTTDSEGCAHPLVELLQAMGREDLFREIKLEPLSASAVCRIAENMVDGSLDPSFLKKLIADSHGNALFVVESLRMLSERGNLVQRDNVWCLAVDELGTPNKFRDIILRRLGTLKLNQRRILDVASVIGEKFSPRLISLIVEQDSLEVLETLNVVARSSSLVVCEGESYRFDHAKSREVVFDEIPSLLKRGYHNRIAQKLEGKNESCEQVPFGEIAYHYAQAGNKERAMTYSLMAGKDALARFSNTEAIKHFNYVVEALSNGTDQLDIKTAAMQGIGEALFAQNHFKAATKTFEQIASAEQGISRLRAFRWAMDCAFFRGETAHLLELSKEAESLAAVDRQEWARVRMNRGRVNLLLGNQQEGLHDFQEALRIDEEEYSLEDTARTLVGLGPAYIGVGEAAKAIGAELRAIAIYEDLQDLRGQMDAYNRAGQVSVGLSEEAALWYLKAIDLGKKIGDFNRAAEASSSLATLCEAAGELDEALAKSLQALEYSKQTDSDWIKGLTYASLVRVYSKKGELQLADEYYEQLSHTKSVGVGYTLTQPKLSRAVLLAAKGHWDESNRLFAEVVDWNLKRNRPNPMVSTNYLWALNKQGRAEEAAILGVKLQQIWAKLREIWEHASPQVFLMAPTHIAVGQSFEARIDLVNASRKPCVLDRIENLLLPGYKMVISSNNYNIEDGVLSLNGKSLLPFAVLTIKLTVQATRAGKYNLLPKLAYTDEQGLARSKPFDAIVLTVQNTIQAQIGGQKVTVPILLGRVSTGTVDVDTLLLGGIPNNFSIVLVTSLTDEKQKIFSHFVAEGARFDEPTFYITTEPSSAKKFLEKPTIYLLVCNPKTDMLPANPNVFTLKGTENLTEIDITLAKAFRKLNPWYTGTKRVCIDITSDVLLQHKSVTTRKWLSGLLTELQSKGFTTIASLDPQMHPKEETQAILNLFDGEVRLYEKESSQGLKKTLRAAKLLNQKYFTDELPIASPGE